MAQMKLLLVVHGLALAETSRMISANESVNLLTCCGVKDMKHHSRKELCISLLILILPVIFIYLSTALVLLTLSLLGIKN